MKQMQINLSNVIGESLANQYLNIRTDAHRLMFISHMMMLDMSDQSQQLQDLQGLCYVELTTRNSLVGVGERRGIKVKDAVDTILNTAIEQTDEFIRAFCLDPMDDES